MRLVAFFPRRRRDFLQNLKVSGLRYKIKKQIKAKITVVTKIHNPKFL